MSKKQLILVVEDVQRIQDVMIHILEAAGFRTRAARTAMEGVRMAREEVPDLILADITLPDQDGATAMSCMKDNPEFNNVPLILVSGLPHDQLVQKMSECGAVDIVQKPFNASQLVSSVKHWLAAGAADPVPNAAEARPPCDAAGLESDRGTTGRRKALEIVTREAAPGVGELRIVGSIGLSELAPLEAGFQELFRRGLHRILVNLSETRTVFSAGIGCFLSARDEAMKHGGDLVFVSTPPELRRLFTMLGLSRILRSVEDVESALAQFADAPG